MNRSLKLPALPLWTAKHPRQMLIELSRDTAMFNRGYRMESLDPGELKFPSWPLCYTPGIVLGELWARKLPTYIGVDLSGPKRPGNAIVAVGLDVGTGRRYPLEVRTGAWTSPKTAQVLAEVCLHHNVQYIQVENNAYQQAMIDWIKASKIDNPYWMKVEAYTTTGFSKNDEYAGLPALEVEFKNKAWVVPIDEFDGHPPTCLCDWCRLDSEVSEYPKGASTDILMALFFARDAMVKWAPRSGGRRGVGNINVR